MRQREITWQGWRVSWPDVDGGRLSITLDDREDAGDEAIALHLSGVADVRVVRVTRYRLAPLVVLPKWKLRSGTRQHYDTGIMYEVGACVSPWTWRVDARDGSTRMQGHGQSAEANMRAAEAALAWLGYRVAR